VPEPEIRSRAGALTNTVLFMFALGSQPPTVVAPACVLPGADTRV
jgi:hypothetical protein